MSDPEAELFRVSYHAVARYVQRILNVTVQGSWETNEDSAHAHAASVGMTISDIRAVIWTPGIAWAVGQGFPAVCNGQFTAMVSPADGVITSICEPYRRETHRMRLLSDREMRIKRSQINRRFHRQSEATEVSALGAGIAED